MSYALSLPACRPEAAPSPVTAVVVVPADAGPGAAPPAGDASPAEPRAVIVRTPKGTLEVSRDGDVNGELVCEVGHPALLRKLTNPGAVLARLEIVGAGGPPRVYIRIDASTAPADDDARRAALQAAGVHPQTLAGDLATARVDVPGLCALLRLPWVASVEPAGFARPR